MEEKKQPRDKNGHFASENGAVAEKASKKKESKKVLAKSDLDWQKAYDLKVLELNEKKEIIKELEVKVREQEEKYQYMKEDMEKLLVKVGKDERRADYFDEKSAKFFETIDCQNSYIGELREQLRWFERELPFWKRWIYSYALSKMNDRLSSLRTRVIMSMKEWN